MPRLIDRILAAGVQHRFRLDGDASDPAAALPGHLTRCTEQSAVIVADNIMRYVDGLPRAELVQLYESIRTVMPPFPVMWIEYHGAGVHEDGTADAGYFGYLVEVAQQRGGPGWLLGIAGYLAVDGIPGVWGPAFAAAYTLNERGEADTALDVRLGHHGGTALCTTESAAGMLSHALVVLQFLNLKNVVTEETEPPPKLSRAYQKRSGSAHGLVCYKTLGIVPLREVVRRERGGGGAALPASFHIVRGGFRDYRERGLFGKHHGVYWWAPHARGDRSEGELRKRYVLKPPASSLAHPE